MLGIYLANTKHFCGNGILQFFKTAEFLENIQYEYMCRGIQLFDLRLGKSDSQTVNIQIVKSFSRPTDWIFKWWLIIAPGEILPKSSTRSWYQYEYMICNILKIKV